VPRYSIGTSTRQSKQTAVSCLARKQPFINGKSPLNCFTGLIVRLIMTAEPLEFLQRFNVLHRFTNIELPLPKPHNHHHRTIVAEDSLLAGSALHQRGSK
jgi:hypothetical protein